MGRIQELIVLVISILVVIVVLQPRSLFAAWAALLDPFFHVTTTPRNGLGSSFFSIAAPTIASLSISPFPISPFAGSPFTISPFTISPFTVSPFTISPFTISPLATTIFRLGLVANRPFLVILFSDGA